ncbi:hypothetical protein LK536_27285 [Lachnoclostridium pacaense]|uniref:BRO-N domain-containing protein n=1 Tax=Enterocloster TaxID=2719313 RepID=UPI001D08CEF9|nr:BRO family protein [Lachnoclostridium pacaense]MCB7335971.1 hypothetical protein [Enterocloster aldenensis]MCC2879962.1 hypothetical protein [Lachnoclostridium pacaense]DAQ87542.1 MAG TPA: antirepressor [Caudoviricetes sp.]
MQELMIFNGHEVEAFELDGRVYFNPYHVGECLELSDEAVRKAVSHMNGRQVRKLKNPDVTNVHIRKLNNAGENFLTESGVFKLIFKSRKPNAEAFSDWVTDEVLPALHKTGTYSVTTTCQYPVSAAAIESATNAGRLFERIMKSEGIPPHEIAMAVRDIFLQAGINVPDYVIRIPAYEQLAMTFGKSGEVACS